MTHASVFSGIGGPEVAASMLGWDNLFHCEINEFGRKVLNYWFPKSKSYEDITKTDFSEWRGKVDVLSGGFPCQPFSYAGQRRGSDDDRYLWPYMFKCIDQIRPNWVVAENVAGITTMVEQGEISPMGGQATIFEEIDDLYRFRQQSTFTIERICNDLESHGYSVQPVLVPACAVGAPHRRDRVFIIGRRVVADTEKLLVDGCEPGNGSYDSGKQQSEFRGCDCKETERKLAADTDYAGQSASDRICGRAWQTVDGERTDKSLIRFERPCTSSTITDADNERLERHGGQELQSIERWQESCEHFASGCERHAADTDRNRGNEVHEHLESEIADGAKPVSNGRERNVADTSEPRRCGENKSWTKEDWMREHIRRATPRFSVSDASGERGETKREDRWSNFPTFSPVHRGNDGLPFDVDNLAISFSKWRTESLKAYGNAIVPQVMYEIFRAIEIVERNI